MRDRLGSEPVLLPTGNWPAGTKLVSRPDFAWRADAVRDERPDAERPEFARPAAAARRSTRTTCDGSYREDRRTTPGALDKFRFARGVLYQSNLGLVRFELDGERLIARQDLYSHPPGKHEAVLVNTYRVPLDVLRRGAPEAPFRPSGRRTDGVACCRAIVPLSRRKAASTRSRTCSTRSPTTRSCSAGSRPTSACRRARSTRPR